MHFILLGILAAGSVFTAFAQDTAGTGNIRGSVRYVGGAPAEGVKACLEGTERCAVSGPDGTFQITDLRPGVYRLTFGAMTSGGIEVRAGLDARVDIDMPRVEAVSQSVTVSEPVFVAPTEIKTSAYITPGREIFQNAGALQDVSRFVQTLPGVAIGADDFRNDIIVRGGSPLENLFIVDNIEVPNINTFANFGSAGGTVGILDSALIEDTSFLTGGYPAPFINRTSSVLQITQREGDRENFHGRVTLGFAGVGTILEGPIKKGKGSWVISARRSFLDLFTKDLGFGGVPKTYTFNGKALYDLTPKDRIWVASLAAVDSIRLGATQDGKNDEEINNLDIRYSGWRNATGFNWQRLYGSKGVGLLGVTYSTASVDQNVRDLVRNGVPPANVNVDQLIASSPLVFSENSREGEATVKYDLTLYGAVMGKLQAGGSYKRFQIRYNTASPLGSDSPYSLIREVNPVNLQRNFGANQNGAYVQATRNFGSRLNLTWGGRIDQYSYLDSARFSPRAGLNFRLTEKLSWRASFGSYFQQPNFLFLAAFPQNRGAIPFRADHYVTGLNYALSPTVRVSVEVYRKNYKDYPVASQFPALSLANLGDTFNIRDLLFPLTSAGRGRAQGIEVFVEKRLTSKLYAQANFSQSSAKQAGLDGVLRPAAFDYRRIFNVTGGYRFNDKWELATRISYLGGRPFTPFNLAESTAQRRGIFDLDRVNAERLKDYARLDVRVDRVLTAWGKPLRVFAGAQNILGRENIASFIWNRRTNAVQVNEQIGVFPIIGLDWRF
ncbi:collagen-binding protein [Bryobacterales bacterium F-183]|nr:collagen-binding protein [Bryobacterales bacterium F-183]